MTGPSEQLLANIEVDKVASLPAVLLKLADACNDPDTSFDEIARLVRQDSALTTKILSVANSPAYAQWGKVDSVNRMLVVLGLETVRSITITSCVMQFFSKVAPRKESLMREFWSSSLQCAHVAKSLAKLTSYENPDTAYLAGLLHRLGQLLFLHSFSEDYPVKIAASETPEDLSETEQQAYGCTHAELAGWIIEQWQIDPLLADAIRYQSAPDEAIWDAHPLVKLINLSSKLSGHPRYDPDDLTDLGDSLFGLSADVLQGTCDQADEEVALAATAFGISLKDGDNDVEALERQRLGLAKIVHNISLLDSPRRELQQSQGIDELLTATYRNLKIIFGITRSCCFLVDTEGQLQGISPQGADNIINNLQLTQENPNSLISRALSDRQTYDSAEPPFDLVNVVDQQVIRALGADSILLLPLVDHSIPMGVLIVGLQGRHSAFSSHQVELLQLFSHEVSAALAKQQRQHEEQKERQDAARVEFGLEARKVVHEVNNPLSIMRNYLHLLGTKLDQDHPAHTELSHIKDELQRVGDILLNYTRSEAADDDSPDEIELNGLTKDICKLFRESLFRSQGIELELRLDNRMPVLRVIGGKVKQVLINLLKNAAEAMEDGGQIQITTAGGINIDGKTFAEIRIQDNGPGIPREIMDNIFSPVVSTKGKGHSGLGLAIAANLVKELHGKISCRSDDRGTEFQILLPHPKDE